MALEEDAQPPEPGQQFGARALGDRAWAGLLEVHHSRVRAELGRFGGREIDTAGDGFLTSFDSPASAIKCKLNRSPQMGKQKRGRKVVRNQTFPPQRRHAGTWFGHPFPSLTG